MDNDESAPRTLETIDTAAEVIGALTKLDKAGVTELADYLDIPKSSAYTYLKSLEQQQFVVGEEGEYRLSHRFLLLGEYVRNGSPLYQFGRDPADAVAEEVGHYAHLVVEEFGRGVSIYESKGEKAADYEYQETKLQQPSPLHLTASGKAILSALPESRVDEIIEKHGLEQWTEDTITSEEALLAELEETSKRGYAYNDEEEIAGFRAVAAPVCSNDDVVQGAITVSGPTSFLDDSSFQTDLPERIMTAANNIEVSINMMRRSSDMGEK